MIIFRQATWPLIGPPVVSGAAGAELDLLLLLGNRRIGVEVKYGAAPAMTRSMTAALHDLALDMLLVVHAGEARYPVHERNMSVLRGHFAPSQVPENGQSACLSPNGV